MTEPPFVEGDRVRYIGGEDDGPMVVDGLMYRADSGWWVRCRADRDGHIYTRMFPALELARVPGGPL